MRYQITMRFVDKETGDTNTKDEFYACLTPNSEELMREEALALAAEYFEPKRGERMEVHRITQD